MSARRMATDEQPPGIGAVVKRRAIQPGHGRAAIVEAGREQMLWRQPVADAREGDSGVGEGGRHEGHPFPISAGPVAAVDEREQAAAGFGREVQGDALVGVVTIGDLDVRGRRPRGAAHHFGVVGRVRCGQGLLRRIVLDSHLTSPHGVGGLWSIPSPWCTRSRAGGWRAPWTRLDARDRAPYSDCIVPSTSEYGIPACASQVPTSTRCRSRDDGASYDQRARHPPGLLVLYGYVVFGRGLPALMIGSGLAFAAVDADLDRSRKPGG